MSKKVYLVSLVILLLIVVLTNTIVTSDYINNIQETYNISEISEEKQLKNILDTGTDSEKEEMQRLSQRYGSGSWQFISYLQNQVIIFKLNINSDNYLTLKDYYNKDWKDYSKKLLELSNSIEKDQRLELEIETLQLRIEKNIPYEFNYINDLLEAYKLNEQVVRMLQNSHSPFEKDYLDEITLQEYEKNSKICKALIDNLSYTDANRQHINMKNYILNPYSFSFEISNILVRPMIKVILLLICIYICIYRTISEENLKNKLKKSIIDILIFFIAIIPVQLAFSFIISNNPNIFSKFFIYNYHNKSVIISNCLIIYLINFLAILPGITTLINLTLLQDSLKGRKKYWGIILISIICGFITTFLLFKQNSTFMNYLIDLLFRINWDATSLVNGKYLYIKGFNGIISIIIFILYNFIFITMTYKNDMKEKILNKK